MPRMIRKQVYVESRQETALKQRARASGISEAEIIRRAIDCQMASSRIGARDPKAWERERAFIAKRMAKGLAPGARSWKRADVYEERLMRYRPIKSWSTRTYFFMLMTAANRPNSLWL